MSGESVALRLDDVGAASKRLEVYGLTRLPVAGRALPFPGNVLFLKYLPPIKRWGPYRELTAGEWEAVLALLDGAGARLTVSVTAGWVERDGRVVPFPRKFPEAAAVLRRGVERGLLEVANHGYTHCVLDGGRFRPRLFHGNRDAHREFLPGLPAETHRRHLARAQAILQDWLGSPVVTLVPPGHVFTRETVEAAVESGLAFLSCRDAARFGPVPGMTYVDETRVVALHDRDLVRGGVGALARALARAPARCVTVRELGETQP